MYCISISHKHTPADIRAHFAFSKEEQEEFTRQLLKENGIHGCVILSTCNRSEIYFTADKCMENPDMLTFVEQALISYKKVSEDMLFAYCMIYDESTSIRHLYKVCCGMDSMVLGEVEILHQVKDAYLFAVEMKAVDAELNVIFQGALNNAKTVTNETKITRLPVSIGTLTARAVIDFCRDQGKGYHVLVVGARGRIGNIVVRDLADFGVEEIEIIGTSRNHKAANAEFENVEHVKLIDYARRYEYVEWADVVISATSSPHYTFTREKVSRCLGQEMIGEGKDTPDCGKQRLFIDLAIPRDMDTKIGELTGCVLKDIDYFKDLAQSNNLAKISEMKKAEWMLEEKIDEISKVIAFQNFRKKHGDALSLLSQKDAGWLLFKLRDALEYSDFLQILQVLEKIYEKG